MEEKNKPEKWLGGRFRLTQAQVDEMRRLRMLDKELWTIVALAAKFNCSNGTVSKICNRTHRKQRIDIFRDGVNLRED